jgi:hypothetical protein
MTARYNKAGKTGSSYKKSIALKQAGKTNKLPINSAITSTGMKR